MPFTLPDFDDRTWDDLVKEGRALIPAHAPEWTDHNASDPGITLLELFAFLTEVLIYRANRIPDRHFWGFLKLINGAEYTCDRGLDECIAITVRGLSEIHRAVTPGDFELLAQRVKGVRRAWCLPGRNLAHTGEAAGEAAADGHVGVLIEPEPDKATHDLLHTVRQELEPGRLLGTRLHVRFPQVLEVRVRATLDTLPGVSHTEVHDAAKAALRSFFDPVDGGSDGNGWPIGRSVYASEVCQRLQRVPGVATVRKSIDPATKRPTDFLAVDAPDTARLKYNRLLELEAVELRPLELPRISLDPEMFHP